MRISDWSSDVCSSDLIDPFRARGIADTIADQGRLTWVASTYDVLAAVRYLQSRGDIDPARIGALGGSRGGTAVMMAAAPPFAEAVLGPGQGQRAVVAGYPWCGTEFPRSGERRVGKEGVGTGISRWWPGN